MEYTIEKLNNMLISCQNQVIKAGFDEIKNNNYQIQLNNRYKAVLGSLEYSNENKHNFTIQLNKLYCDNCAEKEILNTIMHEVIHSLKGCMNHGPKWKQIANKINDLYGYTVSRTASYSDYTKVYEKYRNNKYLLVCNNCKYEWHYKKQTKLRKLLISKKPYFYTCPYCGGGDFFVENLR